MKPLNILYVSSAKSWRGGEQQLVYLFQELHLKGIQQHILCPEGSELAKFCQQENLSHFTAKKRNSFDFGFAKRIAQLVDELAINLVNPHDSHAHTFTTIAGLFYKMKSPIVLHRKVDYEVSSTPLSKFKYNYSGIKKIICISSEVQRVLSQSLKRPEKCILITDGIDIEKFEESNPEAIRSEFGIPKSHLVIGNVAAITQQKDYFTFVDTAEKALFQRKDLHFLIIGDGDQRMEIENLVKAKKLQNSITFAGFRKDVSTLLPSLDILFFTSEKEGLGTTVLDAFAAKVPVVATDAGGIPEIIDHGKNGLLAPVKNSDLLAKELLTICANDNLRRELAKNATEVVKNYTKQKMAEKTLVVFKEVASQHNS